MSQRKKKRKPAAVRGLGTEKRNEKERERVCRINAEYDRLVEQLGGMIVNPGKEWKREAVAEKTSGKSKLRKLDILFEASNYLKELMQESEEVKIKDVEVRQESNAYHMMHRTCMDKLLDLYILKCQSSRSIL